MVSPTLYAAHDGGDRASHAPSRSHSSPEKAAESPALPASEAACLFRQDNSDRAGAGALVRRPPRLHEPFVSPEFAEGLVRATRLDADVSRGSDGDANSWWQQPEGGQLTPQAAPLYTVRAGDGATRSPSNSDVLAALPSPLAPSLKLSKRLAVTAAGCSSVAKSAAINGTAVSKGTDETRRAECRLQSAAVKALPNTLLPEVETESVMPQQQSRAPSKDLSSLVTEATCSWGQELGEILGQAVPDFAASAVDSGRTTAMSSSLARLGLMTTGLFPQTMHLRCDSAVLRFYFILFSSNGRLVRRRWLLARKAGGGVQGETSLRVIRNLPSVDG